jgi:hypothetical protein
MPESLHLQQLKTRLGTLKERFLSIPQDASGQYSELAKDFSRSYRVLAHAEIEWYVRSRADEIVRTVLKLWREKRIAHRVIVSMLACWNKNWSDEPETIPVPNKNKRNEKKDPITIDDLVNRAFRAYQDNIEKVYGILPPNLTDFLQPLGVDIYSADFEEGWRTEMGNFGRLRGLVAHQGESGSREISPDDERGRMDALLPGITVLDEKLNALLSAPIALESAMETPAASAPRPAEAESPSPAPAATPEATDAT